MLQVHPLRVLHDTLVAIEGCESLTVVHRACTLVAAGVSCNAMCPVLPPELADCAINWTSVLRKGLLKHHKLLAASISAHNAHTLAECDQYCLYTCTHNIVTLKNIYTSTPSHITNQRESRVG